MSDTTEKFTVAEQLPSDVLRVCQDSPFRTLQGEGLCAGAPSTFVRLAGCNLRCAAVNGRYFSCDTPDSRRDYSPVQETWRELSSAAYEIKVDDLVEVLSSPHLRAPHLVITGGEPLLQASKLDMLFGALFERDMNPYTTVETNGTIFHKGLLEWVDLLSLSPKLQNLNKPVLQEWLMAIATLRGSLKAQLKIVCSSLLDYKEAVALLQWAADLAEVTCFVQLASSVYKNDNLPDNRDIIEALTNEAPLAGGYPIRLTSQMHKSWGIP